MPRAIVLNVSRPCFPAASTTAGPSLKISLQVMESCSQLCADAFRASAGS